MEESFVINNCAVQIYQVVRKLADEQSQVAGGGRRLTVPFVYDSIRNSNSSLKRRSKKLLEDAIDRVLSVMKEELDDSDSVEGDFDGMEEQGVQLKVNFYGFLQISLLIDNRIAT